MHTSMHVASAVFVYHFLQRLTERAWFLTHKKFQNSLCIFCCSSTFHGKERWAPYKHMCILVYSEDCSLGGNKGSARKLSNNSTSGYHQIMASCFSVSMVPLFVRASSCGLRASSILYQASRCTTGCFN